jgi:hypothetical protein
MGTTRGFGRREEALEERLAPPADEADMSADALRAAPGFGFEATFITLDICADRTAAALLDATLGHFAFADIPLHPLFYNSNVPFF